MKIYSNDGLDDGDQRDFIEGNHGGNSLEENILIEAAAGTGKTTALVRRTVNLIVRGKVKDITDMACITFTHKAAGELKYRIQEELQKLLKENEDFDTETRNRIHRAVRQIDEANFSTIHAFASDLLKTYPARAGVDPEFEILEETEEESLEDTPFDTLYSEWARGVRSDPSAHWEKLIKEAGKWKDDDIRGAVKTLLNSEKRVKVRKWLDNELPIKNEFQKLHDDIEEFLAICEKNIKNRDDNFYGNQVSRLKNVFSEYGDWSNIETRNRFFLKNIERSAFRLTTNGGIKKGKGRKGNWKGETKDEIKDKYGELGQKWNSLVTREEMLLAMQDLADLAEEIKENMVREGYLTFDDLLEKSLDLVTGEENREVREEIKQDYDAFLIDETQDTDPRQIQLFLFLAEKLETESPADDWEDVDLGDGRLFLVGDPKQSIYGFRNADIQAYRKYQQEIFGEDGEEVTRNIHVNFRSYREILDWVDEIFGGSETDRTGKEDEDAEEVRTGLIEKSHRDHDEFQPEYIRLSPPHDIDEKRFEPRSEAGQPRDPGVYVVSPLDGDEEDEHISDVETSNPAHKNSLATARTIEEITDNPDWQIYDKSLEDSDQNQIRRIRYGDIGLLLPKRKAVESLENALQLQDVPFHFTGGKTFFLSEEVRDLSLVLGALSDPFSNKFLVGALQSPFFGHDLEEVTRFKLVAEEIDWNGDEPDPGKPFASMSKVADHSGICSSLELLSDLRKISQKSTPNIVIQELYDQTLASSYYRTLPMASAEFTT